MIPKRFSQLSTRQKGILALISANLIWSAAPPIFKLALQNIPPFTLAFLRFFGASLLLYPFVSHAPWIRRRDWTTLFFLSFFGITLNISALFLGLSFSPSINVPIIASSGPIFLYFISIFILHEKRHARIFWGLLISFFGVLIIVVQPIFHGMDSISILGNLLFVLSTFGVVLHTVLVKRIDRRYSPLTLTFWSFLIGSVTFLPLFVSELSAYHPFATLDWRGELGIGFGMIFSSLLAYSLYHIGIRRISAQEVGLFSYIDPIVTSLLAIPLLGERITPVFLFGSFFVFAGIFVAEGRFHYHPIHIFTRPAPSHRRLAYDAKERY